MGIGIVLLFWLFAGSFAAATGSVLLAGGTLILTRKGQPGRGRAIFLSAALPFIGLCWWGAVFVFQATVNVVVFHRDVGIGDTWETPLPNGYILTMIDVTEHGWVSKNTEGEMGPPISQLQVTGRYILGRYEDIKLPRPYFILDTLTNGWRDFADFEALRTAARAVGIQPALEPIDNVYGRYRTGWFDYLTLFLFGGYPIGALIFWVKSVRNVRRGTLILAAA